MNVPMVLQHNRVKRLAADKNDVKTTLDRFIQEETAFQNEAGRSDAEKKASQEHAPRRRHLSAAEAFATWASTKEKLKKRCSA